ncbi:MAG TPA: protein kinase [Planctomycetaceae bacterium]|nr:protein kinase [Planctomycetaceae bacterium]
MSAEPAPAAPPQLPLERLGDYRIIREIGRGGMGVVYEAEQESLGRRVALKVLPAGVLATSSHLARFEREARSAARLHHTNIVPIYGVGRQDGLHYYVMQFIEGCGLDRVIEELRRQRSGPGGTAALDRAELGAVTEDGGAAGIDAGTRRGRGSNGRDSSAADAARTLLAAGRAPRATDGDRTEGASPGSDAVGGLDAATELISGAQRSAVDDDATVAGDEPLAAGDEAMLTIAELPVPGDEARQGDDLTTVSESRFIGDATISEEDFAGFASGLDRAQIRPISKSTLPADAVSDEGDESGVDETVALSPDARGTTPTTASPQALKPDVATAIAPAGGSSEPDPGARDTQVVRGPARVGPASSITLPGDSEAGAADGAQHYWRSVARIGVQVADALAYAHRHGTLHRDIKPANLLLDRHGRVWVTDFGLAKAAGSEDLTQTGDIVGTIRYMSPERFEGTSDGQSDLYGLGLTLYELLARRPAYDESGRNQLIAQVMKHAPPPLTTLDRSIPGDLATIVHKSIERDPAHRYQTARALADDLERYLDDRPIKARRATLTERLWRWSRRNPALAALTMTVVALLVLLAAGSFWGMMHFRDQVAETERALEEVRRQQTRAEENFRQARAAVDEALVHISENQLLRVPGFQPLRKELLAAALRYYEWFVARRANDPTLRGDLAESYFRLGEITAEIGEPREALEHLRQAQALREELLDEAGGGAAARQAQLVALARGHARRGELEHALARQSDALASFESARDLWRQLGRDGLDAAIVEPNLADTYNGAGRVLAVQGNPTEALHCYHEAAKILRRRAQRATDSAELRYALARVHTSVGELEQRIGLVTNALESLGEAREVLVQLVASHPEHRLANQFREDLGACHEAQGELLVAMRNPGRRSPRGASRWPCGNSSRGTTRRSCDIRSHCRTPRRASPRCARRARIGTRRCGTAARPNSTGRPARRPIMRACTIWRGCGPCERRRPRRRSGRRMRRPAARRNSPRRRSPPWSRPSRRASTIPTCC